tara:strand:+ start:966 stop:1430 length:465 start_codon:yes stop_codon:yes gene_type:complete
MAIIPNGQKFHTVSSTVDTTDRGSSELQSQREIYTMQDIKDSAGPGYKVFAVLLSQTGTNDPTFTVLKNDFPASNTFSFTRVNTGGYRLNGAGNPPPFPTNKTVVSAFNNGLGNGGAAPPQSLIWTLTGNSFIDFLVGADGVITLGFFEVRVYD